MKAMGHREDAVFARIRNVAHDFDNARWSPHSLGQAFWFRRLQRRREAAARDPEWAAIESRRDSGRDGFRVFLSDDLTLDDWYRQHEIEDWITPATTLDRVALAASRWETIRAVSALSTLTSRVRRGWAPIDCWSLGHWLCRSLGHAMLYLAAHNTTWPGNEDFPTAEDWEAALRKHGQILAGYDAMDDDSAASAAESLRWVANHLVNLWD